MASGKFTYLSYRWHRICNPFSFGALERVLEFAELRPGEVAYDLGCGNAVVAAWLTGRYGLHMQAVEQFSLVAELARATAAAREGAGSLRVVESDAASFLEGAPPARLISVIGTVGLFPDVAEPRDAFARLARSLSPGGYLLWGDPFWRREPSDVLSGVFRNERYQTLAGWVAEGEAAGLVPISVQCGSEQEWDDYAWRINASVETWLAENPDAPEAEQFRTQIAFMRRLYVEEVREAMGFGLYLFRRPA